MTFRRKLITIGFFVAFLTVAFLFYYQPGDNNSDEIVKLEFPLVNLVKNGSFEAGESFWDVEMRPKVDSFSEIDLAGNDSVTFLLAPEYLEKPLDIQYVAEEFVASMAKSIVFFEFRNKQNEIKSRLTYVLSGSGNHGGYNDLVVNGVSYLTVMQNDNPIGKKRRIIFQDVLEAQNNGALKIGAAPIMHKDIGSVRVVLATWFEPGTMGKLSITHRGWDKYVSVEDYEKNSGLLVATVDQEKELYPSSIYHFFYIPSAGKQYLELRPAANSEMSYSQKIAVIPGKYYFFCADTKKDVGTNSPEMRIRSANNDEVFWEQETNAFLAQNGWVRNGGIFKADSNEIKVELIADNTNIRDGSEYYFFDNVQLVELPMTDLSARQPFIEGAFNIKLKGLKIAPEVVDYSLLLSSAFKDNMDKSYGALSVPVYDIFFDEGKFYDGSIEQIKNKKQSAVLRYNDAEYSVKIGMRGDNALHYLAPVKSFRIDFKSPSIFEGKSSINLLRPISRDFLYEQYSNFVARGLGLNVPQDKFVFLRMNGRPYGLMYEIEQWSSEFLERNKKPVGDLYNDEVTQGDFNGGLEFIYKKMLPIYWGKYTSEPSTFPDNKTNILLLTYFMNNDFLDGFKLLVDKKSLLEWNIHSIIVSSHHQDYSHNTRLYFDSTAGMFQFVPWDLKWQFHQYGADRINPFMDFLLKDISIFNERNKILWNYLQDTDKMERNIQYYKDLVKETRSGLAATPKYAYGGEEKVMYADIEKFILDIQNNIKPQIDKVSANFSKNVSMVATFQKLDDSLLSIKIIPINAEMISSALVKGLNVDPQIIKQQNVSVYVDDGDDVFDEKRDRRIDADGFDNLDVDVPSMFQYETYVTAPPGNMSKANFKSLTKSDFLTDEEKNVLKENYEFVKEQDSYALVSPLNKVALKNIFKKIGYTPRYKATTLFIKNYEQTAEELSKVVKINMVNAVTGASLVVDHKVLGTVSLKDIQTVERAVTYDLSLVYLDKPITIKYFPEKFTGAMAKSIVYFDFFDKKAERQSRLTYVLNGEADHYSPANRVENDVSYVTKILDTNVIEKWNDVTFENILRDQNDGAKTFDAIALKKSDISAVKVTMETWFDKNDVNAAISVSYRGWDDYKEGSKNDSLKDDVVFTKMTFADILKLLERKFLQNVDASEYEDLLCIDSTRYDFLEKYPIFVKDPQNASIVLLKMGSYQITETIIVPKKLTLIIEPGAVLKFSPRMSLIGYGNVRAIGTEEQPIIFTSLPFRTWGVVGVVGEDAGAEFEYCIFQNGGEAHVNGVYFSGMLSVYHTNATVKNCEFRNGGSGGGDDTLNFKNGRFSVESSSFYNGKFDAIDFDFAEKGSIIRNNYFHKNGNDGIDVSGSLVTIENNKIEKSGDKCISLGEGSDVFVYNNVLDGCNFGIAAKDSSSSQLIRNTIVNNNVGAASYNKKETFGGSFVNVHNSVFSGNKQDFGQEIIDKQDFRAKDNKYISLISVYDCDYELSGALARELIRAPKSGIMRPKKFISAYLSETLEDYGFKFANLLNTATIGAENQNPYFDEAKGADEKITAKVK